MVDQLVAFCTSYSGQVWLVLASDLVIAIAYFAIPITMAVVLRERKADIPYPWLWLLFVTFIVACGLTHFVHVWSVAMGAEQMGLQTVIQVFTAVASIGTALAFVYIMPQIKNLPSPRQQQDILRREVAERTREKDQLIREINHRIGNQLQILSSLISIETRKAASDEVLNVLERLRAELHGMAEQHVQRSRQDYLGIGIATEDGRIVPATGNGGIVAA